MKTPIAAQSMVVGGSLIIVGMEEVFTDPDGDVLIFAASSSESGIATVQVEGSTLTLTPVAEGGAIIVVTADDGKGGVASVSFEVTVGPEPMVTEDGQITIRPPIMPGDVNEDERITLVDALFALQASLGKRTLSPTQEQAADVNGDSRITLVDALFILQASLGKRDLSAKPVAVSGAGESHPIRLQGWFEEEEDQARLHLAVSELAAGALDVQLRYNPEQLKWMGFEAVESVDPALVEVHSVQPGELRLARLGITAAGEVGLGRLLFQRRSTEMSTEVEVETVEFFDLNGRGVPTDATHFRGRLRALPSAFMLYANKPNPFNPETTIRYDLAALPSGDILPVRLTVYNVAGQLVRILFDEAQRPGSYTVQWNGHDEQGQAVSSGVYLYRLEAGDQVQVRRMLLLR